MWPFQTRPRLPWDDFCLLVEAWVALAVVFRPILVPSIIQLRCTRRYSPLYGLTSSSCGGLRPTAKAFFALVSVSIFLLYFYSPWGRVAGSREGEHWALSPAGRPRRWRPAGSSSSGGPGCTTAMLYIYYCNALHLLLQCSIFSIYCNALHLLLQCSTFTTVILSTSLLYQTLHFA